MVERGKGRERWGGGTDVVRPTHDGRREHSSGETGRNERERQRQIHRQGKKERDTIVGKRVSSLTNVECLLPS